MEDSMTFSIPCRITMCVRLHMVRDSIKELYADFDAIDPWVGGLAEDHQDGANVGELVGAALKEQFQRLRDGDRFWYENDPFFTSNRRLKTRVESTTLADIIRRNTNITDIQDNVFIVPGKVS